MTLVQDIAKPIGAAPVPRPAVSWHYRHRHAIAGYVFLAPFLLMYSIFLIYPVGRGFWISLHDWELVGNFRQFIGFANYEDMVADPIFWKSLRNTAYFTTLTVPAVIIISLALAVALNRGSRAKSVLRGVFFASSILSVTFVTLIWQLILNPSLGLLAPLMTKLGIPVINFLADPTFAMPAVAVATLWWSVGFPMMLFLAGLQQIPEDLYEAATLDGAGPWRRLLHITLPQLRRTIILVLVLQTIAHFQVFGQILLMTAGGPGTSTRVLVQNIYESGFRDWQIGYASAQAMILFVVMFIASGIQLRLSRKEVGE